MKKLLALLLALCALCGTALAAEPLRVLDDWFAADRYEKRYPERALERIEPLYDETGEGNQNELLFAGEWDAAVIETNGTDLSALCAEIPSAASVAPPTVPSAVRPFARWNHVTASYVLCPNTPSTLPE